jgi:SAM-dependent methyltransferase
MDHRDHVDLLRTGVEGAGSNWADLGSGTGAFTLALADLLGPGGSIVSVDRDRGALRQQREALERRFPDVARHVVFHEADFTTVGLPMVDGIVMANALHYVPYDRQAPLLARLVARLVAGGRFIVAEYDADHGNTWVPYPISWRRWQPLAVAAGLVGVREIGRRPSRFLGSIDSAVGSRPADVGEVRGPG